MKHARIWLACLFASLPLWGEAVSLSEPIVRTGLGQRFIAEVEILDLERSFWSTLTGAIAAPDVYKEQGIEYPSTVADMDVFVLRHTDGRPYFRIVGHRPLNEAFIDLVLDVGWQEGHLVRKYTVLPEPPVNDPRQQDGYDGMSLTEREAKKDRRFLQRKIDPADQITGVAQTIRRTESPESEASSGTMSSIHAGRYRVNDGDNLYRIAYRWKDSGLSIHQRMLVLYQSNPNLFSGGNPNRIIRGRWMNTPKTLPDLPATEHEAYREWLALAHSPDRWHSGHSLPEADESSNQAEARNYDEPHDAEARPQTRDATASKNRDRLTVSRGMTQKELESYQRLLEMEIQIRKLIDDAQKRRPSLAMSNELAEAPASNASSPVGPLPDQGNVPPAGGAPLPSEVLNQGAVSTPSNQQGSLVLPSPTDNKEATENPSVPPKPATTPKRPRRVPRSSLPPMPINDAAFSSMPWWIGVMALTAAAMAVGAGIFSYRRQRQRKAAVEALLKESAELADASSIFSDTGQSIAEAAATPADLAGAGSLNRESLLNVDTEMHVDPLTEADVYITYERYDAAEALLKTAFEHQPESRDVMWRLFDVYQKWGRPIEAKSFAARLHQMYDARDPKQRIICEVLGIEFGTDPSDDGGVNQPVEEVMGEAQEQTSDAATRQAEAEAMKMLELATAAMVIEPEPKIEEPKQMFIAESLVLNLDVPPIDLKKEAEEKTVVAMEKKAEHEGEATAEVPSTPPQEAEKIEPIAPLMMMEIPPLNFDFSELSKDAANENSSGDHKIEDDPIHSQLELAKTWMVQGKPSAARALLEAIVETGTPSQKERATALLNELPGSDEIEA